MEGGRKIMPDMTHLSLFSGIGGLDLAAEMAGFRTVGQCEYAEYQTKVLEKNWPEVERWTDIHELRADEFYRRTGLRSGSLTVLSGGFPCQPHSVAGKRKASGDKRDLWPEYRRIVDEIRPKWVVAENVRGLLSSESGRFFRGILRDLADMGYDAGWCCYRAADVGAVHPRERVGIIAHTRSERIMEQQFEKFTEEWDEAQHRADNETADDDYVAWWWGGKECRMSTPTDLLMSGPEDAIYLNPNYCEIIMGFPERWTELCL